MSKATAFVAGVLLASMFWIVLAHQSYCAGSCRLAAHGRRRGMPMKRSEHSAVQSKCPLWVISGHFAAQSPCPLYPQKRTLGGALAMSAKGQ
jgi:hypothetical protein